MNLYPTSLKNRIFGFAKALGLNDRKRVHVSNIDPVTIIQSRELSLKPKTDFSITLGIKRSIFLLVLIAGVLTLPSIAKRLTHSFHVSRLFVTLPDSFIVAERKPIEEIRKILSQDFEYLGRGSQAFVFSSADGQYVLKLFIFDSQPGTLLQRYWGNLNFSEHRKIENRARKVLNGSKTAFQYAADETGLVYVHLNLTKQMLPSVWLRGPAWKRGQIDLDSFRFVLQVRAQPFDLALIDAYRTRNREKFDELIDSFLSTLSRRISRGIYNTDPTLFDNFGFYHDCALEIDFGNYVYLPDRMNKSFAQDEKARYTRSLMKWAKKYVPEWKEDVALRIQGDL